MAIKVQVDATRAISKLSALPEAVRRNLRNMMPPILEALGERVDQKLDEGLKSRRRLVVKKQFDAANLYGTVQVISTEDPSYLPEILERGARAHEIAARNALALHFYWEGESVFFKRVWHPGYPGLHYMQSAVEEMRKDILSELDEAVRTGAREVNEQR
jgi:hypothetical protein